MKRKYYVHALLWYWGGEHMLGPFRWKWYATYKAHMLTIDYPYGCAIVTESPDSPEIVRD